MKKGWTTTKLIGIGSLAALRLLVKLCLYTPFLVSSGNIFSGVIIEIIAPFFLVLSALLFKQPGSATIYTLFSLAIELPLPGMFPQPINFAARLGEALSVDLLYSITKSRKWLFGFLGGFSASLIDISFTIIVFFSTGLLGVHNVPGFFLSPISIVILTVLISTLGGLSGIFASFTYERLKNTNTVKRVQGNI